MMVTSIFERKRDLVYLIFFIVHIPVMLGEFAPALRADKVFSLPFCFLTSHCNALVYIHFIAMHFP
jgi:hypothetical protein